MCFKKTDKRKIYKTTDGFFNYRKDIKKPRPVGVIHQRNDKAVAVVKLHSVDEERKNVISNLVIRKDKHSALTKDSYVENSLIIGRTKGKIKTKEKIMVKDLESTNDKLTWLEYLRIKHKVNADTNKHKRTRNNTIRKWKKHFKK